MKPNAEMPFLTTSCAKARTLLFVPGNRPERIEKAFRSGADAIVPDLEDGAPASEKAAAREAIERAWPTLQAMAKPLVVRINAAGADAGADDVTWLKRLAPPHG